MRRSANAAVQLPKKKALTVLTLIVLLLQAVVLVKFASEDRSIVVSKQKEQQEKQLADQLEALKQSDVKLKRLSLQVKGTLQRLQEPSLLQATDTEGLREGQKGVAFPSGNESGACVADAQKQAKEAIAAVVSITFDRADYLRRHVDSLLAVHGSDPGNRQKFPLYISQDGPVPNPRVAELAKALDAEGFSYLHHQEDKPPEPLTSKKENLAYYRIANHYKFLMRTFFDCFGYSKLIILEDDMELAPDFFSYFEATAPLLETDDSLFCVSSWNDHGQSQFVQSETQLYRSDFFPGLGWMLTSKTWSEIRSDWPRGYWDDWMRLNSTRKGRQCIRPEICRTYNFGARGSSKGQFYKRFLAPIRLSTSTLDWTQVNLGYLDKVRYDQELNETLSKAAKALTIDEAKDMTGDVNILYKSQEHYETLTERLGILREWKDGVPRGGYNGVVIVQWGKCRLLFSQAPDFVPPEKTIATVKVDQSGAIIRQKSRPGGL